MLKRLADCTQGGPRVSDGRAVRQWVDHPTRGQVAVLDALDDDYALAGTFLRECVSESTANLAEWVLRSARQPDPSRLWHITPEVLEGLGKTKEAVEEFERSISAYPGDASGYNNLAYLYARRGEELDRAETLVDKAMRLEPRHNVYYMDTAGWCL